MWIRYIIIIGIFFIAALLQASFLPHFTILGSAINLLFILFFTLIFFEKSQEGFFIAILAGFFLDMFLPAGFFVSILSLVIIYFLVKAVFYFLEKTKDRDSVLYFGILFSVFYILHQLFSYGLMLILNVEYNVSLGIIFGLVYNLIFAVIAFYLYKFFFVSANEKQLKLF